MITAIVVLTIAVSVLCLAACVGAVKFDILCEDVDRLRQRLDLHLGTACPGYGERARTEPDPEPKSPGGG